MFNLRAGCIPALLQFLRPLPIVERLVKSKLRLVRGRADLYGLGATVYALIAGRPPFTAPSLPELITRIRNAEPDKPKKYQMGVHDMFQGVVMKLLAKRPEDRFQTATELLKDLDRVVKAQRMAI